MGRTPPRTSRACALVLLAALALLGCRVNLGRPHVQGSGVVRTEQRDVTGFDQIDVGGAIHLDYTPGKDTTVEVTTDDNLLPLLVTEVSGGTLHVFMQGSTSTSHGPTVKVSAPALKGLTVSGASSATLTGLDAPALRLTVSGASHVTASGTADRLDIDCSGASQVHARGLTAKTVKADVSGASTAEVHATEEVEADASGASTVRYAGSPARVKERPSGASSIHKE